MFQRAAFNQGKKGSGVLIDIGGKQRQALHQLRNHHAHDKPHNQQRRNHCKNNRNAPPCFAGLQFFERNIVEKLGQRIENIGNHKCKKNGFKIAQKLLYRPSDRAEMSQHHIERYADTGDHSAVIPFLF